MGAVIEMNGVGLSWEEGEVKSTGTVLSSMGVGQAWMPVIGAGLCYTRNRLRALAGRFGVRLSVEFGLFTR